jgi:biopolymer transport protein ExbD
MNQGFSISFVGLSLILLLWFCAVTITPCGAGLPWLPITDNPESFGFENQNQYPILTIKEDGNKFLDNDWIADRDLLSSSIQNSDYFLIRADARLPFGEVRKALAELKKYRTQGILLLAERKIVDPKEISPFEEYILNRSLYCGC